MKNETSTSTHNRSNITARERDRITPPITPYKPNPSKMERFNQGTRKNSEALGLSLSVIMVWVLKDILGIEIPPEVMAALFTAIGIIVGRFHDAV